MGEAVKAIIEPLHREQVPELEDYFTVWDERMGYLPNAVDGTLSADLIRAAMVERSGCSSLPRRLVWHRRTDYSTSITPSSINMPSSSRQTHSSAILFPSILKFVMADQPTVFPATS